MNKKKLAVKKPIWEDSKNYVMDEWGIKPLKPKQWYKKIKHKGYEAVCHKWFSDFDGGYTYALYLFDGNGRMVVHAGHAGRHTKKQLKRDVEVYLRYLKNRKASREETRK